MRQRLGLADVLVKDPSIIILDEPTTAIDPAGVEEVLELVRELAREGAAVLLASHLLHQVQQVCDEVGIFVSGKLVASGPMEKLSGQLGTGPISIEVGTDRSSTPCARPLAAVKGVESVEADQRDKRLTVVHADHDVRAGSGQRAGRGRDSAVPPAPPRRRARRDLPPLLRGLRDTDGGRRMTAQSESLPVRRAKRKSPSSRVRPRHSRRSARRVDESRSRACRPAGGRSRPRSSPIEITSLRFLVLTIVLTLAGAAAVYSTAGGLEGVASERVGAAVAVPRPVHRSGRPDPDLHDLHHVPRTTAGHCLRFRRHQRRALGGDAAAPRCRSPSTATT